MASTATSTATSTAPTARPTLTDIDSKLLRYILAQEARQFQETSTPVGGARKPLNANAGQGNSLLVKIAASLLRYECCVVLCYVMCACNMNIEY